MNRRRGRPVLGVIAGLLFGAGVAVLLQQAGIWPLDNLTFFGLPLFGVALGLTLALWAPLGRRPVPAAPAGPPEASEAAGAAPSPPTGPPGPEDAAPAEEPEA